jgi:hypothetical protein
MGWLRTFKPLPQIRTLGPAPHLYYPGNYKHLNRLSGESWKPDESRWMPDHVRHDDVCLLNCRFNNAYPPIGI